MSPANRPSIRRVLVLAVVLVAASCLAGVAAADTSLQDDGPVPDCAASSPADHAEPAGGTADTIGYVDGYWYDESVDVDASDGLSDAELRRLAARTAARAEALRCLRLTDGLPPVTITDRDALGEEFDEAFEDVSSEATRFDNAVLSTMLLVGHEEDSVDAREEAREATVGGYYDPETGEIVVVRSGEGGVPVGESTLAHEMVHALQHQNVGLQRDRNVTTDRSHGQDGLIEGDANLVQYRYDRRCAEEAWAADCPTVGSGDGSEGASSEDPPNWGLYLQQFQPYSDGPAFVESIEAEGGWAAVDDRFGDYPESALYVMSPELVGEVDLEHPPIASNTTDAWDRLDPAEWPGYETVGPAGIGAMVIAPTYESSSETNIVNPLDVLNLNDDGEVDEFDPLNYEQPPVEGWRGDRLAVFERGNDTATIWRSAWASERDATEFREAYEELLSFRDAQPVANEDRYRFPDNTSYEGVVAVEQDGDRVRILTAPSEDALGGIAPDYREGSEDGGEDAVPGFGPLAAVVGGLLAVTVLARRGR